MVHQEYQTEATNEYIVKGNSALVKCRIPSNIADLVEVIAWIDSEANEYRLDDNYGNSHSGYYINMYLFCNYSVIYL